MKLTGDTECPGCKKTHKVEFDLDKLDVKQPSKLENMDAGGSSVTVQQVKPIEPEKIIETKTVIEDFKPNYECPDGNCDVGVHKNKNYSKRVKGKCTNCDQFTKNDNGVCPWCNKDEIEEIDEDTLTDLGISMPQIVEHEEHNHE